MGTLGKTAQNGKKRTSLRATRPERAHPAVAKLAIALREYKEAVEQQAATAEILHALSRSSGDPQPVFEAIVERAHRLTGAVISILYRYDGEKLSVVADRHVTASGSRALRALYPAAPRRDHFVGRAVLTGRMIHSTDMPNDPRFPGNRNVFAKAVPYRAALAVPLAKDGVVVGAIATERLEARGFTKKEIRLLQTFAHQAVIAIENVRLFNETREALERQTATADILRVISGSPTDIQPVLRAVAESAARLCDATDVVIRRVEGNVMRAVEHIGAIPLPAEAVAPVIAAKSVSGRAVSECKTIHIHDVTAAEARDEYPEGGFLFQRGVGYRSLLVVPMVREGNAIGVIIVRREELRPFSEQQIKLLQTFADQAVIAIENVRLFNETKEALEQQTATSGILGVISSSPTDLRPVFEAILANATALCEAHLGLLHLYDGEKFRTVAQRGASAEFANWVFERGVFKPEAFLLPLIAERRPVHVSDMKDSSAYRAGKPNVVKMVDLGGARSFLVLPLLKEGQVIGALAIYRPEVRPFTQKQIALVSTFANQAVIAIENTRLFNETKEALEQQKASGEVLGAISSSIADTKPVFDKILESCEHLFAGKLVGINLVGDDGLIRIGAYHGPGREDLEKVFPLAVGPGSGSGLAIVERRVMHYPDVEQGADVPDASRRGCKAAGIKSVIFAPMMWEGRGIGAIFVGRDYVGPFSEKEIALLKTFSDQAVIAIQNARLFNETKEALEQQTATAEVLKLISRTTFDLAKVLQALLDNATRLSGARRAAMLRPDAEGNFRPAVTFNYNLDSPMIARMRERPIRPGRDSINGRALLERRPIHVPDVTADAEYGRQDLLDLERYRTVLSVPMLRDGEAIGLIALIKGEEVDPFTDKQMELVTTFADQAVIAIENVRLFQEIQEKTRQLETANKHKSDFLANMSHELRTPLNAIIGFSEVLSEKMFGELNEKQADYMKDIHESGKHLLSLINDILDLSKIEAGRMELDLASFHLPTAISNAMTLVRERAQRHGIRLGAEIDPRLGEFQADERKVKQILVNLLSNAVKFTPDGGRVDVAGRLDTHRVEIAVRDSGIGIALEDQSALFEEFKQVGKDSTRKAEGTGLGLALTKRFVELHGGEIRVDSAPGKGSTFTVTLPVRP